MNTTPDTLSAPSTDAAPPAPATTPAPSPAGFDWKGTLAEDFATYEPVITTKGFKTPADALRSYSELEKRFGSAISPPAADAKPEEWDAFYAKLGRPEQPDAYSVKRPDDFPEDLYNPAMEQWFRATVHRAGLTDRQAMTVHQAWLEQFQTLTTAQQAAMAEADAKTEQTLRGEWGGAYDRNVTLAQRAAKAFADPGLVDALIGKGGSAAVVKMFAAIGEKMGEASLAGPADNGGGFAPRDAAAAQAELQRLQSDPEYRKAMLDRSHPKHAEFKQKNENLYALAYPAQKG